MPSLPPVVKGYLFYDGVWNDVSNKMRQTQPINISRGADSEQGVNSPTKADLLMDNRSGDFSPRNPLSPLYDKIGRNTPMRIAIEAGPPYLLIPEEGLFNDSALVAQDQSELDFDDDVDIRIDCSSNGWQENTSTAMLLAERYNFDGDNRCFKFARHRTGHLWFGWSSDGTFAGLKHHKSTVVVPFYNGERVALRVVLDVDNGLGGYTLEFFYSNQIDGEWNQLGDSVVTTSGTTAIFNGNGDADLWLGAPDDGNLPDGTGSTEQLDGKIYAYQHRNGIDGPITVDLDIARDAEVGDTSITDATTVLWSLQEGATFSNEYVRIDGEVPSWPPNRNLTGSNKDVAIEPTGITRRLDAGNKPLESALLRYIRSLSDRPIDCWPLTDGPQANGGASLVGGQPMVVRIENAPSVYEVANEKYGWASDSIAEWIEQVGVPPSDTNGFITGECREDSRADAEWSVDIFFSGVNNDTTTFQCIDKTVPTSSDGTLVWNIEIDKSGDALDILVASVTEVASSISLLEHITAPGIFDGQPHYIRFTVQPGSSPTNYEVYIDGDLRETGSFAAPSEALRRIRGNWFLDSSGGDGFPFGFITYWGDDAPSVDTVYQAMLGFPGEASGDRFNRLIFEQGLAPNQSLGLNKGGAGGEPQFQQLMGVQGLKRFLELLQECADTDLSIFMEKRDSRDLVLRARSTLYNQAPRFTLDFSNGVISPPFKPVDDDKLTENDVTIQRDGGASSQAVLETGRMSIQDYPDGVGRYDVSKTRSLYQDSQAADLAYWNLHMGTFDGLRYTKITLDLANDRVFEMLPQILNTDLGDIIRITNLPNEYGPDDVDLMVRGYDEEIGPQAWKITFNCSPGETWRVARAGTGDATGHRVDTVESHLSVGVDSNDTQFQIASSGDLWINTGEDPYDFPMLVRIGGEVVRVNAITSRIEDLFNRTVETGWGILTSGQTWTTTGGSASDFYVEGV